MADEFDRLSGKKGKRRKCYYDFSKNYPGTRYDKNKRSSTSDALDNRKKYRTVLWAVLIILAFMAVYFVVYTAMEISHTPVAGLEEIGVTQPAQELTTQIDENVTDEILTNESTDENATAEQTSDSAPEQQ